LTLKLAAEAKEKAKQMTDKETIDSAKLYFRNNGLDA
jgi:hypothetical protein